MTSKPRRGLVVYQLLLIIILVVIVVLIVLHFRSRKVSTASTGAMAFASGLPVMPAKPTPHEVTFDGCPPGGDGRDPVLNELKNRVDTGNYVPVQFDAVERLPWPHAVERETHAHWSAADRAAVGRYEGIPVAVEGYLAGAKVEGPESPNCHGADGKYRDWHIWMTGQPGQDRTRSVVVETTPRVRAGHPGWTIGAVRRVVRDSARVRISGWLMLDPEHPDQVGKTRGTIWEIHPIMKIEVQQRGRWVPLEDVRR